MSVVLDLAWTFVAGMVAGPGTRSLVVPRSGYTCNLDGAVQVMVLKQWLVARDVRTSLQAVCLL